MNDHIAETAPDDRNNGEEFWSAGEEFCSCHSDEEEDGGNTEFRTLCNDDGDDDDDYEYSICSPLEPKRDDKSGAYMKNTESQYDLQHSSESEEEKNCDEKKERKQHSPQNNVSKSGPDWKSQSTKNRAIKDCISSDKSKSVQGVACKEDGKSGSLENIMRIRSLENKKRVGERNIGVNTKRVGLVIGNRQLTSVAVPDVPSMIEFDDQSGFPDQQKDKNTVKSKFDHRGSGKRADNILRGHQGHDQLAPKQTEQLVGDETYAQSLSSSNQKSTKTTNSKRQEKSGMSHGKQNGVQEFSCDQSGGKGFVRDEVPQNNLSINHLRDDEEHARGNLDDSSQSQIKDETEDLMVLVLSTVPDGSESIENVDANIDISFQGRNYNGTHDAGSKRDKQDKQGNQTLQKTTQKSPKRSDKEAQSLSYDNQRRTVNTGTKGKDEVLYDEDNICHVCNHCLKHLHESSCDRSGGKSFPKVELLQSGLSNEHSRNGDTKGGQFFKSTEQDFQGKVDNSEESCKPLQRNNKSDDKRTSIQFSVPALSHLMAHKKRTKVEATYPTKDSPSIQVNKLNKELYFDIDTEGKPCDNGKQTYLHSSKYPSCERSDGANFQKQYVPEKYPQTNHLRSGGEKRDQHFMKWKNKNLKGKLDDETHTLSLQRRRQNADIKENDQLLDNGKQDDTDGNSLDTEKLSSVHPVKYPQGPCEQSDGKRKYFPDNDLPTNQSKNGDHKRQRQPSEENNEYLKGKLNNENQVVSRHGRDRSRKADINLDGSIQSPLNVLPINLRNDDEDSTSPLIRTNQNLEGNFHDETQTFSHERRTQKAGFKHSRGSTSALQNDLPTKLRNDEDSTPTLIRTNQNCDGKLHYETQTLSYKRRTQKANIKRPSGSSSTPQNELPTNSRNHDEGSTLPFIQGELDDTGGLHGPCQQKEETDLAASIKSSSQEASDIKTGKVRAEMDSTLATDASVSIRGNMELSSTGPHKKYFFDMWMKGKFCDVNIVVDDHAFLAHRVVLAANSEYFEKFFLNSPARTDDTDLLTVYVTDMSADVFRVILRYMYTGHADIEFSQVSQLLRGSLFLTIESLTNALQDFLLNTWKGECIGAFCLAQTAGLHDLYKEILNYIRTHFVEVSTSEHFALCPVEHASSILSDDNLWINEETDVLYAVLLWLEHHARDTSSNLRLLRHVRFEYIPLAIIDRIEKSHLNYIANESVKRYIQDARKRTSCLEVDQLHFDPPIIRQRIAEVTECRTVRTKDSEITESPKSDLSFKTSDKEKRISPSKEEQPSSHTQGDGSISPCQKSPSSSKSCHYMMTKAVPFPSYHEIDTTAIRVSVSQDVSTSPVVSNDDLGERSCHESAENETNVQVVRIGGISRTWKEDCVHSDIEKLESGRGKRWEEWAAFAELPVAMHHHAACYIHNSIYISGGHVQLPCDARSNYFQPSHLFHVYDLLKRKWYRLKDLEQARVFHQMVALFGQVYVIGGQGHDGGALSAVERYSPYTDSWRQAAPLSFPRYATAATAYNFHLWVVGGATNHVTGQVTSQNADGGQQSGDESGASVYDGFYKSANTFLTGVVECYSPHNDSWTKINGLPTPRCHASLLRIKKRLYLVGGFCCIRHFPTDEGSTSSVDVYDDVTESWRYVTDVGEGNYSANTIAVGSKIVILGKPGPLLESDGDIISIYDTSTNKWELRRSLLLESRVGHACCAIPVSLHSPLRQT